MGVAYVRKVRTASGAVAVQVARKRQGQREIVAHVGSAHTDVELGILLEKARRIADGDQEALELATARKVARVADVADWRPRDVTPAPQVAGAGRTTATTSRLLYDVIGGVYDWLGFDVVEDPVFRDLVIARIVEPTSKLDSVRVLDDLGASTVSYKTIDRHVRKVHDGGYRDLIATKCFAYAGDCGGLSLILYDVTVRREALVVRMEVKDLHREALP